MTAAETRMFQVHGYRADEGDGDPYLTSEVVAASPEAAMQAAVAANAALLWDGDYDGPVFSECRRSEVVDLTDLYASDAQCITNFVFANGWWERSAARA